LQTQHDTRRATRHFDNQVVGARDEKRGLRIEEDDVRVALHGLGEQRASDTGADHHHPRLPSRRLGLHHPLSRRRAVCSHRLWQLTTLPRPADVTAGGSSCLIMQASVLYSIIN
jgi:hypothetical protein